MVKKNGLERACTERIPFDKQLDQSIVAINTQPNIDQLHKFKILLILYT